MKSRLPIDGRDPAVAPRPKWAAVAYAALLGAAWAPGAFAQEEPDIHDDEAEVPSPLASPFDSAPTDTPDTAAFWSYLEMEIAVTTATKIGVKSALAPSIVTVIPRTRLLAQGARHVGEALNYVPGVYIVDDGVTHNVAIRGLYGGADSWSRLTKVMVDGQPVTLYSTGGSLVGPELIPMGVVDSIEVIRGPGSALYGANAFLGVINVKTRPIAPGLRFELSGEGGLIGLAPAATGELTASFGDAGDVDEGDRSGLLVSLSRARLDRSGRTVPPQSPAADTYAGRASEDDLSRPASTYVKGNVAVGQGSVSALFIEQRLDARAPFSEIGVLTRHNRLVVENRIYGARIEQRFLHDALTVRTFGSVTVGESLPEQRLDTGAPAFYNRRDRKNVAYRLGTEARYVYDRHSLLLGSDYLDSTDRGDTLYRVTRNGMGAGDQLLVGRGTKTDAINWGAYGQLMVYPFSSLGVIGGARYDANKFQFHASDPEVRDSRETRFTTRAGLVYAVLEELSLKALYGTSFVPPAPAQLTTTPLGFGRVRGNPELRSQNAQTIEASVAYRYGEHFGAQLNAFQTKVENRVEFITDGSNLEARNMTVSTTHGAELSTELQVSPFFGVVNLSLQDTKVATPRIKPLYWDTVYDPDGPGGTSPPGFPAWMADASAGLRLSSLHVEGSARVKVVGPRKSSQANIIANGSAYTLPTYATVDLTLRSIDLRLTRDYQIGASIHVTNLFDTQFANAGAQEVDIPSMRRSVFLKLSVGL